jgi:rod shape-determining protein MreD
MLIDPRCLILVAANALLLYLTQLVNSSLAAWSLHLVLLGPMLILPSLYLKFRDGFLCCLLTGLWVDAALPVPYGLFTGGSVAFATGLYALRHRFRAEHNYHPNLLSHTINAAALMALTASLDHGAISTIAYWLQVLLTALLSHLCLLFINPWFFNLERLLFHLLRVDTEPEDLPLH